MAGGTVRHRWQNDRLRQGNGGNTRALILELLDFVDDVVDDLGCREDLQYVTQNIRTRHRSGQTTGSLRAKYNFARVVDYITSQTLKGI